MKILIISQYFWPENFRINDLCIELNKRGYDITVLTGKPNYPSGKFQKGYNFFNKKIEFWNNIKILRVNMIPRGKGIGINLILNYFTFSLSAIFRILFLKANFDKIIIYQLSPATVGFPGLVANLKFNAPIFFYIQDLWPESLSDGGGYNNKILLSVVNSMMNLFYKNAFQIWVQSEGFIDYLVNKGVNLDKIKYLPNTVEKFYFPHIIINQYKIKFPIGFNILFAGNIGVAQDFQTIIKAAEILNIKELPINWIILGDGREKEKVQKLIFELNLTHRFYFFGTYPSYEMPFYFACADALLVTLRKSFIFSITIPSKLQSYLACRKPIIGNIDGVSADVIKNSNSGVCSSSGNFIELAKNIEILFDKKKSEREKYALNGHNYFLTHFERKIVYDKLEQYLNIQKLPIKI